MRDNIYVIFSSVFVIILFTVFSVILYFNIRNDLLVNEFKENDKTLENLVQIINRNITGITLYERSDTSVIKTIKLEDLSSYAESALLRKFLSQDIYSIVQIDSFFLVRSSEDSFVLLHSGLFLRSIPLLNWENISTRIICYNSSNGFPDDIEKRFERYSSINHSYGFFQTAHYIVNYRSSSRESSHKFTVLMYVPKSHIFRQLSDVTLLFSVLLIVMIVFLSIFVLFYVNSLTRIIKLEESTKRERELLKINHQITAERVSESIVHNINNPLTAARGFLELFGSKQPVMYETYKLDKVMSNINFVIQQLRSIMENSRKSLSVEKTRIDLTALVSSEIEFLRNMIESSGIRIFTQFAQNIPVISGVYGDFKMVVSNLIENACDAMYSSDIKNLTVTTSYDDLYLYIYVEDTGCGMSDAVKEKIFDLYFTTKSPDKDILGKPVGTGIGLYSVSMILKKYNASISCDTIAGKGTTFTVKVPHSR